MSAWPAPSDGPGLTVATGKPPRYRTGDEHLDRLVSELLDAAGRDTDRDLVFESIVSCLRMAREGVERGDLKIANTALKELRYSFEVFEPYEHVPKVTIFGSARTPKGDPAYRSAHEVAHAMVEAGWMVMTGAGPGIMTAGLEGAGRENAFGINIVLPFEGSAPELILGDTKLINFRYFFTRKLTFVKESAGYVLLPGGFGTMDEAFEVLTLTQTGKTAPKPIVMLQPEGSTYWDTWAEFCRRELLDTGLISPPDLNLVRITSSIPEAVEELTAFYRTYHSLRFVGGRLVIRLRRDVDDAVLERLNREFTDIVVSGGFERTGPLQAEVEDDDAVELPRLVFRFDNAGFARLRQMIDVLNGRS